MSSSNLCDKIRFFQGDRSAGRAEGGLGIGLAMVHRLVELHGGSVAAHSEGLGYGSEFTVRLPRVAAPAPRETESIPPPAGEARTTAPADGLRVLVVDDNRDAADTLGALVSIWGHEARTAYDGAEALELARRYRPQVVRLDVGMPGMDGYEVARRLRQDPALAGARLVALTGYGQQEDRQRSREAGFDDHLVKPVEPDLLQQVIDGVAAR